ncbi:MAG: hypothetical protein ACLTBV_01050 [Enterocloster bolteae]
MEDTDGFYVLGMGPILTGFDLGFISKLSTSVSLLQRYWCWHPCGSLASKYPQCVGRTKLKIPGITVQALVCIGSSHRSGAGLIPAGIHAKAVCHSIAGRTGRVMDLCLRRIEKKEIPQDLDVDYIGGSQKKKESEK